MEESESRRTESGPVGTESGPVGTTCGQHRNPTRTRSTHRTVDETANESNRNKCNSNADAAETNASDDGTQSSETMPIQENWESPGGKASPKRKTTTPDEEATQLEKSSHSERRRKHSHEHVRDYGACERMTEEEDGTSYDMGRLPTRDASLMSVREASLDWPPSVWPAGRSVASPQCVHEWTRCHCHCNSKQEAAESCCDGRTSTHKHELRQIRRGGPSRVELRPIEKLASTRTGSQPRSDDWRGSRADSYEKLFVKPYPKQSSFKQLVRHKHAAGNVDRLPRKIAAEPADRPRSTLCIEEHTWPVESSPGMHTSREHGQGTSSVTSSDVTKYSAASKRGQPHCSTSYDDVRASPPSSAVKRLRYRHARTQTTPVDCAQCDGASDDTGDVERYVNERVTQAIAQCFLKRDDLQCSASSNGHANRNSVDAPTCRMKSNNDKPTCRIKSIAIVALSESGQLVTRPICPCEYNGAFNNPDAVHKSRRHVLN